MTNFRSFFWFLICLGFTCCSGCNEPRQMPQKIFQDVTSEVGLEFEHINGMIGEYYFCEMMGAGVGVFDADNDGDLDVYLVQGGPLGEETSRVDQSRAPTDRLFRNDLERSPDGESLLKFTDITETSGINGGGYGMGITTGDIDNDGWTDLYITNLGSNQLWKNLGPDGNGNVSFRDVTIEAGVDDERFSTSAVFFDYDGDGLLDLFVVNYVDFRVKSNKICRSASGKRDYCGPQSYEPEADRLFHNLGGGVFEDVSRSSGISAKAGAGLGVIATDFDMDGRIDLYVANDGARNFLWKNQGDGTFIEDALSSGCAANMDGRAEASMGVESGDFDNDGDEDIFMTHLRNETNTLFLNDGQAFFEDVSSKTKIGSPSIGLTGFGTVLVDFDNDGWLDFAAVGGAVYEIEELAAAGDPFPLDQPNLLLKNLAHRTGGGISFSDVSDLGGSAFVSSEVSRGLAAGDLDNDGDSDLVLANNEGPARVLINLVGQQESWLGLSLVDRVGGRPMLGAQAHLKLSGDFDLLRRAHADGSYCSASDSRVLFGLPGDSQPESLLVHWPDGSLEEWTPPPPAGRYTTIVKGTGALMKDRGQ